MAEQKPAKANRSAAVGRAIALVGIAGLSTGAADAKVAQEREALAARVDAVRLGLAAAPPAARGWLAQATNWNNWPKWSKWSNWANQ